MSNQAPTPEPQHQLVTLTKTTATSGHLHTGARYEVKLPTDLARDAAIARAYRMLERSVPDENPNCWTVEEPDQKAA